MLGRLQINVGTFEEHFKDFTLIPISKYVLPISVVKSW